VTSGRPHPHMAMWYEKNFYNADITLTQAVTRSVGVVVVKLGSSHSAIDASLMFFVISSSTILVAKAA